MNFQDLCMGCMSFKGDCDACPYCGWEEGTLPEFPQHLMPRTILINRYIVGRVLGHGGFGITYLGWDMNLNVKIAIKEYLPAEFATRPSGHTQVSVYTGEMNNRFNYGLDKFLDEARTLAQFNDNPGIVSVHDFFKENGTAYIVMNYLEGITLKEYLEQKGGKISFDAALKIVMPVIDALREVHNIGMLHRDISPDNIFITNNKQVKLLDFGAARYAVGEQSKSLSIILKPGYAPEEQYRSRGKQGAWTDIYAVAATIYRAITGEIPPDALDRLAEDTIRIPSNMGINISPQSERTLMKALSIRASNRFQTITEFQEALTSEDIWEEENKTIQQYTSNNYKDNNISKKVSRNCYQINNLSNEISQQDFVKKKTVPIWLAITAVVVVISIFMVIMLVNKKQKDNIAQNTINNIKIQDTDNKAEIGKNEVGSDNNKNLEEPDDEKNSSNIGSKKQADYFSKKNKPVESNIKESDTEAPNTKESSDFIISYSGISYLTNDDLSKINPQLLDIARNEIYARHGYIFKTQKYRDYFEAKDWYLSDPNFDESSLSEIEIYNVELIKKLEDYYNN